MGSIEIFYNFQIGDANRNVFWQNLDRVDERQKQRMDAVWGDRSWESIVYSSNGMLFKDMQEKASNKVIAKEFRRRLIDIAGFKYVPQPIPMRNSRNAVIYYLYFASPNKTGEKIVKHIFNKYKDYRG